MSVWKVKTGSTGSNPLGVGSIIRRDQEHLGAWAFGIEDPFNNCQTWSIASFGSLVNRCIDTGDDIIEAILDIRKQMGSDKRLLVVDIYEHQYKWLEDKVKFHNTMPYKNLTGNDMRICIIDLR